MSSTSDRSVAIHNMGLVRTWALVPMCHKRFCVVQGAKAVHWSWLWGSGLSDSWSLWASTRSIWQPLGLCSCWHHSTQLLWLCRWGQTYLLVPARVRFAAHAPQMWSPLCSEVSMICNQLCTMWMPEAKAAISGAFANQLDTS